jgi:hypothetical protein
LRRLEAHGLGGLSPVQDLPRSLEQRGDAGAPHEITEAVPDEHRADFAEAWQVANHTEWPPSHDGTYLLLFPGV